jgi:hypothetical protein
MTPLAPTEAMNSPLSGGYIALSARDKKTLGTVRKLTALVHTALKIGSKYSFTLRKLRLFADFCLVWPSLADFSDSA